MKNALLIFAATGWAANFGTHSAQKNKPEALVNLALCLWASHKLYKRMS